MSEQELTMPEFVRKAILAQGKCDPDEVARKAAEVDLDAPVEPKQLPLAAEGV